MKNTLLIITAVIANAITVPAQDLTSLLQKGLAEEEINRDPAAAIEQYGILLKEFDKGRQLAATALFRIAECHRKIGDEAAAAMNLQQLIALYPKQEKLVLLARQNLTALGVAPALPIPDGPELSEAEAQDMIRYRTILRDRPDTIKNSPYLSEAIRKNHVMVTRYLLEQGANPNGEGNGIAMIVRAVQNANLSIVKLLLNHGAEVTPWSLDECVKSDYSSIEPVLLDAIKSKGEAFDYFPALDRAIAGNRDDLFNRLVANGADPKALGYEGKTLLHTAASRGQADVCESLLKTCGRPVGYRDERGLSALDFAASARSPETVKILLSLGADPKALAATRAGDYTKHEETQKISVLMQLLGHPFQKDHDAILSIIQQLIAVGVDVNHQDSQGDTALHFAVTYGPTKRNRNLPPIPGHVHDVLANEKLNGIVVELMKAGADMTIKNRKGMAPVDLVKSLEKVLGADK